MLVWNARTEPNETGASETDSKPLLEDNIEYSLEVRVHHRCPVCLHKSYNWYPFHKPNSPSIKQQRLHTKLSRFTERPVQTMSSLSNKRKVINVKLEDDFRDGRAGSMENHLLKMDALDGALRNELGENSENSERLLKEFLTELCSMNALDKSLRAIVDDVISLDDDSNDDEIPIPSL